jgi:alkylation response protein AidB-like acyl-CoA dehydrogenase
MIPKAVGGASESWLDVAIGLEEYYRVDASLTIHAVGTALGLLPLIIGGASEQQKKYLAPFISGEGDHLASLTHSEPGGTANFLEKGGKRLGVTAKEFGDSYIVKGEKVPLYPCYP